jgi:tetratricopeptide (TPR) repeat protein
MLRMLENQNENTQNTSSSENLGNTEEAITSSLQETNPISIDQQQQLSEDTVSSKVPEDLDQSTETGTPGKRRRNPLVWMVIAGFLLIIIFAFISGYFGYQSGIHLRTGAEGVAVSAQLQEQYNLGMEDIEAGSWDRARQRFEYIIRQDSEFPGARDQLILIQIQLSTTATPSPVPEPTLTPTPDLRSIEERFTQAEQYLANSDWTNTIDTLLALRKEDPEYKAVQIDGMLFLALRNRGMDKIGKQADLEGGIYDLALAERFGPIDSEALSYLNWARLYITGASFWEVNWEEAVNYFSQIAPQLPYLRDGSGLTAMERYRLALIGLGKYNLQIKPCAAVESLELALSIAADEEASLTLEQAIQFCAGGVKQDKDKNKPGSGDLQPTTPVEIPPTQAPEPTPYP